MPSLIVIAAVVAAATGVVHSVLGERLIFRPLRAGGLVPSRGAPPLRRSHVRILRATWHLASVFAWALAWLLVQAAWAPGATLGLREIATAVSVAHLVGAALVLVATRGRHPGWMALATVAALPWVAVLRPGL